MTHHHHDNSHGHEHRHHHQHHHGHSHGPDAGQGEKTSKDEDVPSPLSMKDKLTKLLDHWVHHNQDHVASYRLWAERARSEGFHTVGDTLETVAQKSVELTDLLQKAKMNLAS